METELLSGPRAPLDLSRYRADLAELKLTADQESELLSALWNIMSSMVELGFYADVCGLIFDEFKDAAVPDSGRVRLSSSPTMETPADGSGEERQ